MKACVYLNFDGDTEAALAFYHQALGGTLDTLHRFGDMPAAPGQELPAELAQRVMHQTLHLSDSQMIMASDTMPGMGPPRVVGTHASISIHPDSRDQADQIFAALSEGGTVTMPLADQFWGDYYGALTDRYGVQWMVNFNAAGPQG